MKILSLILMITFYSNAFAGPMEDFEKISPVGSWATLASYESPVTGKKKLKLTGKNTTLFVKKEISAGKTSYWIENDVTTKDPKTGKVNSTVMLTKFDAIKYAKLFLESFEKSLDPNFFAKAIGMFTARYIQQNNGKITKYNNEMNKLLKDASFKITNIKRTKVAIKVMKKKIPTNKISMKVLIEVKMPKMPAGFKMPAMNIKQDATVYLSNKYPFRVVKSKATDINDTKAEMMKAMGMGSRVKGDQRKNRVSILSKFGFKGRESKLYSKVKK